MGQKPGENLALHVLNEMDQLREVSFGMQTKNLSPNRKVDDGF